MLEQEILTELQKLNQNMEKQNKNIAKSFFTGFMHSLGNAFGTLIIWGIAAYIFSLFSGQIIKSSAKQVEQIMSTMNWEKILPKPKMIELPSNFNLKDLNLNSFQSEPEIQ